MSGRAARGASPLVASPLVPFLALFALLGGAGRDAPLAQERRLIHEPPDSLPAGAPWECVVRVARPDDWQAIDLFYRRAGAAEYALVPFRDERGAFRAAVPGAAIAPPALEYYLVGRLAAGDFVTLPAETPESAPLSARVAPPASAHGILLLSPLDGEVTATSTPEIGILFDPPLDDPAAAALLLDGIDRSSECERSIDFLLYMPKAPLEAGGHEATVVVLPDSGGPRALTWRFSVLVAGAPPTPAVPSAPAAAAAGARARAWGRCEIGWALVTADEDPDPLVLPYAETSGLAFDVAASVITADGKTSLHADAARDPIYDDEVRGVARLERGGLRAEAGDIYPYLSELSVAWQSGKGGLVEARNARWSVTLLGLRTLEAEVIEGFGTYSRFLYAGAGTARFGANRAAVNLAYSHDRAASIPDSARFIEPQINRVASLLVGRRIARGIDLALEVARSGTSDSPADAANALRIVATFGEIGESRLLLEYRDIGSGYLSVGSPTIDSGERGVVIDATARLPARLCGSARAEIYRDHDIFPALAEGTPIVQATARLDHDARGRAGSLASYAFARYYRVPYADVPYKSGSATLGAIWQRGRGSLTASLTRGRTVSGSGLVEPACVADTAALAAAGTAVAAEDEWTASATASLARILGGLTARAGLRWTELEPDNACRGDRWTATAEASLTVRGTTLSGDYQRIDNRKERIVEDTFVEHLVTVTVGRSF
jgi:hypothetical protein